MFARTSKIVSAFMISGALALAGCGGGGTKPVAGSGGGRVIETTVDKDGSPGWLRRGSLAIKTNGKRMFFGVGGAAAIKNPALLRTTADNRARAELAKVFEVFSASLMKDYMESYNGQETQEIENAIKTFSAMSLKGSEIIDRYIDKDGTMYALAALDFETVKAVAQAEEMGAVTSHVREVTVDDMFDKNSKQEEKKEEKPAVATAETTSDQPANAPKPAEDDRSNARQLKGGNAPNWVSGSDPRFPWEKYLCGVGVGPARQVAEDTSYAALSRIFYAKVKSVSQDFMGAYSKTGAESIEVQEIENTTTVSTGKIFSGVEIMEVWISDENTHYALACLERAPAARILKQEMADAEERASSHLANAGTPDKVKKVTELRKALRALMEWQALNAELRIVNTDGVGMISDYSHVDVAAAYEAAAEAVKIAVVATGKQGRSFRSELIEGLQKKGLKIVDKGADEVDILVTAKVRTEPRGEQTIRGNVAKTVYGIATLEVRNMRTDKVYEFEEEEVDGKRSVAHAERAVIKRIVQKHIRSIVDKVVAGMFGGV